MAEVTIKTGDVEIKVSDQRQSATDASKIAERLWHEALGQAINQKSYGADRGGAYI